jgi:DNA-binding PadR family transcriptional regulator
MNARTLCLAILNFGEATGYEIRKQSIEGDFSYFVDTSFGAIYPALTRLTEEGLVECRDEVQPGKPARKVYSITPAGRAAFVDALHQPVEPDVFKSQFLLVSMCSAFIEPAHMSRLIDERIVKLDRMLEMLRGLDADCDDPGTRWTIDYGVHMHQSSRDYLAKNRDALIANAGTALAAEAAE